MHWNFVVPFIKTSKVGWLPELISNPSHSFEAIPAKYNHDRSRPFTSGRQWLDYFLHALSTVLRRTGAARNGYVSAFPQIPIFLGLLKKLRLLNGPIIAWTFNVGSVYGGWKGELARFALRDVDIFVVHSRAEIDSYAQWLRLPRERFAFVPLSVADPTPHRSKTYDEPFLLSMGTANRDYKTFYEAVEGLDIKVVVVAGNAATRGLKAPANVTILRNLSASECNDLLYDARLVAIPLASKAAASGQVSLVEAMILGKPVVATSCDGTADYVVSNQTGVMVEPQDPGSLRNALLSLWNNDTLRKRIGESARLWADRNCTFRSAAHSMNDIMNRFM